LRTVDHVVLAAFGLSNSSDCLYNNALFSLLEHIISCARFVAYAGGPTVKVFYAGVRWGISLPRSVVGNTKELARALNEAFAGEILSVGRGENLKTVFVDSKGIASEMPFLHGHLHKEAATSWEKLAEDAARVYVRGVGSPGIVKKERVSS
jgi:hypothetical protein